MYRYSICDPSNPKVIEMGQIEKERVQELFFKFPWEELMAKYEEHDYFSPSLEIENLDNKNGVTFSLVDINNGKKQFYIFYKRPKRVHYLFGLIKKDNEHFLSDKIDQTEQDALDALTALLDNDLNVLEKRWG